MNAQQLLGHSVLDSSINLKPSYMPMPSLQQAAIAPTQVARKKSEEAELIPEDELYAILWDNVYTGR